MSLFISWMNITGKWKTLSLVGMEMMRTIKLGQAVAMQLEILTQTRRIGARKCLDTEEDATNKRITLLAPSLPNSTLPASRIYERFLPNLSTMQMLGQVGLVELTRTINTFITSRRRHLPKWYVMLPSVAIATNKHLCWEMSSCVVEEHVLREVAV